MERVSNPPHEPSSPEWLDRLRAHPRFRTSTEGPPPRQMKRHSTARAIAVTIGLVFAAVCTLLAGVATFVLIRTWEIREGPGHLCALLTAAFMSALGIVAIVVIARNGFPGGEESDLQALPSTAGVEWQPVRILRLRRSQCGQGHVDYELGDGSRHSQSIPAKLSQALCIDDLGVAQLQDGRLIGFERLDGRQPV
jgi:hypothetical protein